MPRGAREFQRAGTLSAIIVLNGETAGLYTYWAAISFRSPEYILRELCFTIGPPIFAEALYIANR
jgi:hypothetical protein